jgi:hypothetical protein
MANLLIQDLKDHLIIKNLVTDINCNIDYFETGKDFVISQYAGLGSNPSVEGFLDQTQLFQILSINQNAKTALTSLNNIYKELITYDGYKVINSRLCIIAEINSPFFLKVENNAYYYVFNIRIQTNIHD